MIRVGSSLIGSGTVHLSHMRLEVYLLPAREVLQRELALSPFE